MINLKKKCEKPLFFILDVVIVILLLFPLYSGFLTSIGTTATIVNPTIIPKQIHWQNYIDIWRKIPIGRYMLNGIFYAFISTFIVLAVAIPASYALSRFRFRGKGVFLFITLSTQMFSVAVIIIPLFLLAIKFNLLDSCTLVIIINAAISTPLGISYLHAYFNTIPLSLEEAGMVDGCTRLQAIIRLLLPVAVPGLAASAAIIFTMSYKQFFIPLILLFSEEKFPALIGVYMLANELFPQWNLVMASVFITIIPPVTLFIILNRFITSGLTTGSVKG